MEEHKFVSRGGVKLQAALDQFKIGVLGKVVLDVGSSTGGFVDCLIQNGADKIYALDISYGELAWTLRNNPKVMVMERTNILHLEKLPPSVIPAKAGIQLKNKTWIPDQDFGELSRTVRDDNTRVDFITIDAGWTRLELVLPKVKKFLKPGGSIIALLKPQYEIDQKFLERGIVPEDLLKDILDKIINQIKHLGFNVLSQIESPILGGGGNKEYLLLINLS